MRFVAAFGGFLTPVEHDDLQRAATPLLSSPSQFGRGIDRRANVPTAPSVNGRSTGRCPRACTGQFVLVASVGDG